MGEDFLSEGSQELSVPPPLYTGATSDRTAFVYTRYITQIARCISDSSMSARRISGGDLKDSKEEEGGEEAVAMAEAEAVSGSEMMFRPDDVERDAADLTLIAEPNQESKKRRVSTKEEASIEFLDSATTKATAYKFAISSMARANKSNFITEENYNLLHWLYRIRNVSCPRGLRISFLQPDFLWSIYRPMMRSRKLWRTDGDIKVAADLWCLDRAAAEERYGHISDWDVSSVTDMRQLFQSKTTFNDEISRWDVSSVTNMFCMFNYAVVFNQPVGDWDVSNVTNMLAMFLSAQSFNQYLEDWDVSNVADTSEMFCETYSFNQPVGDWDVSKVTNMYAMFQYARDFNQPVGDWDVSNVTRMCYTFRGAASFNQDITRWDMSSVEDTHNMFGHADTMQKGNKPAAVRDDVYEDTDEDSDDDDEGEWEEAGV